MRRLFWVALGLGAGATAAVLTSRWLREQRRALGPSNLARQAGRVVGDLASLGAEAVAEFRRGMRAKEAEVRASLPD